MEKTQRDVMCVLLQTLLEKKLITPDIHDKSREKILRILDCPNFFCSDANRQEESRGNS